MGGFIQNIKENIEYLQIKKYELENLKKEIKDKKNDFEKCIEKKRKIFEKSLEPLKNNFNSELEKFNLIAQNEVCVKLDTLVKELSLLSGIDILDIGIEIRTNVDCYGKHNIKNLVKLMDLPDQNIYHIDNKAKTWEITLFANKDESSYIDQQIFRYDIGFKLNLEELQSDGKTLLQHCSAKIYYDEWQGEYYTKLDINKNIGNLNCNISLDNIVKGESPSVRFSSRMWYPADLFTQAIINCVEKQNNEKQQNFSSKFKVKCKKFKLNK